MWIRKSNNNGVVVVVMTAALVAALVGFVVALVGRDKGNNKTTKGNSRSRMT